MIKVIIWKKDKLVSVLSDGRPYNQFTPVEFEDRWVVSISEPGEMVK